MQRVQLVYVSSMVNGYERMLPRIVESAMRHNTVSGVSSLFLVSQGNVIQVLEGSVGAVRETMVRIAYDARHFDINTLLEAPLADNTIDIDGFHLGLARANPSDLAALPASANVFSCTPREIRLRVQSTVMRNLILQMAEACR